MLFAFNCFKIFLLLSLTIHFIVLMLTNKPTLGMEYLKEKWWRTIILIISQYKILQDSHIFYFIIENMRFWKIKMFKSKKNSGKWGENISISLAQVQIGDYHVVLCMERQQPRVQVGDYHVVLCMERQQPGVQVGDYHVVLCMERQQPGVQVGDYHVVLCRTCQ